MYSDNLIVVAGQITSKFRFVYKIKNKRYCQFTLSALRPNNEVDRLIVVVSQDKVKDIKTLNCVLIKGYINTRNVGKKLLVNIHATYIRQLNEDDYEKLKYVNRAILRGYICNKPVKRLTLTGHKITNLKIAVNRPNKSDYIPCIVWRQSADSAAELEVGNFVKLAGRLQSRNYTKKENNQIVEHITYEVSTIKEVVKIQEVA